jgi:hypothetical protein
VGLLQSSVQHKISLVMSFFSSARACNNVTMQLLEHLNDALLIVSKSLQTAAPATHQRHQPCSVVLCTSVMNSHALPLVSEIFAGSGTSIAWLYGSAVPCNS